MGRLQLLGGSGLAVALLASSGLVPQPPLPGLLGRFTAEDAALANAQLQTAVAATAAADSSNSSSDNSSWQQRPLPDALEASSNGFVLVVKPRPDSPATAAGWLEAWLSSEEGAAWLKGALLARGALLFRGFAIAGPVEFENVALAVTPKLEKTYLGTSPRSQIAGTRFVHTAADFKQHITVPPHLEMSFKDDPPKLQLFYAKKMDQLVGGETPLVDFKGVWEELKRDTEFMSRIEGRKIKYIRRYSDCAKHHGFDPWTTKCWQDMFRHIDANKTEVLAECASEHFGCSWDEANTLTIENVQPLFRRHQLTGEETWFNHMNVLVPDSIIYDYERTALLRREVGLDGWWPLFNSLYYRSMLGLQRLLNKEEELGHNVVFEDGSLFPAEDFLKVKRAIWHHTVQSPYEVQDVVLLDNLRVAHGREIYSGERRDRQVMTAWSDDYPAGWQQSK